MTGRSILHYQILERLGAGGMGEIYKAQDTKLNRMVAIKALSDGGDADSRRRFIQEAQAASSLNHPNIITIHDIIAEDDHQFMVMEYVNGRTLADLIAEGPLGPPTALKIAVQIADGLSAAHAVGIVHRDLKPGNIMVTPQGRVKILDFGLAKLTAPAGPVSLSDVTQTVGPAPLTVEGAIVGTVSYMSPEQGQGARVDARSDIFSFGSVLYEMLTGTKAFPGDSPLLILTGILRDEPRPIGEISPETPPALVRIVNRALRKAPGDRWQTMQEMFEELTLLKTRIDSGIFEAPAVAPPVLLAAPPKRRSPTALIAVAGLLLASGGYWWFTIHRALQPSGHQASPVAGAGAASALGAGGDKPSAFAPAALTNQAILDMVQAKVPADVIVGHIRESQTSFNLSTAELIRLAKGGVSEPVLQAMRNPSAPAPAAQPDAAAAPPAASRSVPIIGGAPFEMTLVEGIPPDCQPGDALHFRLSRDVTFSDVVVAAKGTPVTGVIVAGARKKFLRSGTKPTYRLMEVTAVDGSKLKVRATPGRSGEARKDATLEPPSGSKSKDALVTAGTRFTGYFDEDQTLHLMKP